MQMKVGKARDQKFVGGVNDLSVFWELCRRRGRNRLNFLIGDHDSDIWPLSSTGGVD
jgi:hypothetical protein